MSDSNAPKPVSGLEETIGTTSNPDRVISGDAETVRPTARGGEPAGAIAFDQPPLPADLYEISREIGRGGMGRVVAAHDRRLDRPVALKLLQVPTTDVAERFRREARITAQLQHPGIVPIYEAGRIGTEPFYAMKHVAGVPFDQLIAKATSTRARLALLPNVIAVADALAFAHARHIVHRDLKPQNVIVGEYGETVVIDWGLAKDLSEAEPAAAAVSPATTTAAPYRDADGGLTVAGAVMGTPAYMPPEQARGEAVDERADVYAIGAMLYHALSGTYVYPGKTADELLAKAMAAAKHAPLVERAPEVPPDLSAIVEKALAPLPADRYASAKELAEDLRRFQTGQLVGVHRYTVRALVARWVRKHRGVVTIGAIAVVIVATLAVIGLSRIARERSAALAERAEAIKQRNSAVARSDEAVLAQAASLAATDPAAAIAWLKRLSPQSTRWSAARTIAADAAHHGISDLLPAPGFSVSELVVDDSGRWLVAHSRLVDHLQIYDLQLGTTRAVRLPTDAHLGPLSPDGKWLAITTAATIHLVDVATGQLRSLAGSAKAYASAFTPDSASLIASSAGGPIVFSIAAGAPPRQLAGFHATVRLSRDGRTLTALSESERKLRVFTLADGAFRDLPLPAELVHFEVSADGSRVAGRSEARVPIRMLDVASGTWSELTDSSYGYYNLAFDGNSPVSVYGSQIVRWDAVSGAPRRFESKAPIAHLDVVSSERVQAWAIDTQLVIEGRDLGAQIRWQLPGKVETLAISRDGKTLFVADGDATLRRWRIEPPFDRAICGQARLPFIEASPDGRWLVQQGAAPGAIDVCDPKTGELRTFTGGTRQIEGFVFSPDGQTIVTTASHYRDVTAAALDPVLWDLASGRARPITAALRPKAVSNGGARIVGAAGEDLAILDVATGKLEPRCKSFGNGHVSADGQIATQFGERSLATCTLATGATRTLEGLDEPYSFEIAADGSFAAATAKSGAIWWNLAAGTRTALDLGTLEAARSMAIARRPGGPRLAIVATTVGSIFDGRGGLVRRLRLPPGYLEQVAFAPDGTRLVVADHDNGATIHDLATGQRRSLRGPETTVRATFFDDGRGLVSIGGSGDTTIWRWRDDLPSEPAALRAWIDNVSGAKIDDDGRLVGSLRPAR